MISAETVKELREMTGAGMMDCKKVLEETNGDMDKAIELLRERGIAKAAKKAGRVAAEGLVDVYAKEDHSVVGMIEVNSETDFVAKNEDFKTFVATLAKIVAEQNPTDVEALKELKYDDKMTVGEALTDKIATIGENLTIRRFARFDGKAVHYLHGEGRIGAILKVDGDLSNPEAYEAARDIAMQIAAMNPPYLSRDKVPADVLEEEKKIILAQIKEDPKNANKPEDILEKMSTGKVNKFYEQNCLLEQEFVKDDSQKVEAYLTSKGVKLLDYVRFEKGEGIEKRKDDLAEEVRKQLGQE